MQNPLWYRLWVYLINTKTPVSCSALTWGSHVLTLSKMSAIVMQPVVPKLDQRAAARVPIV